MKNTIIDIMKKFNLLFFLSSKSSHNKLGFSQKTLLGLIVLLFCSLVAYGQTEPYITIWKTDNPGSSSNTQITIPASGMFDYTWEEVGNSNNYGSGSGFNVTIINFGSPGTYQVAMTPTGTDPFYQIQFNNEGDKDKILDITQWGDIEWRTFNKAFRDASNLEITAMDVPDLSRVTNMSSAFAYTNFSAVSELNNWNTENVTNMSGIFNGATSFNQDIGGWNVENVTNMSRMFYHATSFNQDIGGWNTENVINMAHMFLGASYFNQDIGGWNVSNVTDMTYMFASASSFNQDIGGWNTENVINMTHMFLDASYFNQDIGGWDVSNVTDMSWMFNYAFSFNQDIGGWDVSNVSDMSKMFDNATSFNQDIGDWNVKNVIDMRWMFDNAISFNQDIGDWNTENVTNMLSMFYNATSFNQDIGNWNVANVTHMTSMFNGATFFNQDIGGWDVSNVTDMSSMFADATSFNQDIGDWNIANESNMGAMFAFASSFNQDLGRWNVRSNYLGSIFSNSGINCENYSATLKSWANNPNTGSNVSLGADGMQYSPDVEVYRNILINDLGWTIDGDSEGTCTLSVNSEMEITFDLYPNPTNDFIYIYGLESSESINLYDISGKLLHSFTANNLEESIDMTEFASGIYFLNIKTKDQIQITKKIVRK